MLCVRIVFLLCLIVPATAIAQSDGIPLPPNRDAAVAAATAALVAEEAQLQALPRPPRRPDPVEDLRQPPLEDPPTSQAVEAAETGSLPEPPEGADPAPVAAIPGWIGDPPIPTNASRDGVVLPPIRTAPLDAAPETVIPDEAGADVVADLGMPLPLRRPEAQESAPAAATIAATVPYPPRREATERPGSTLIQVASLPEPVAAASEPTVGIPRPPLRPAAPTPVFVDPAVLGSEGRSPGCGRTLAQAPTSVSVDGRTRRMRVDLPANYDPNTAHRLIIGFHGRTNTADQVRSYYDLDDNNRRPTIFVYPEGLNHGSGAHAWFNGGYGVEQGDYAIFDEILGTFAARACLDLGQVFAVGHSLGGSMVGSLACARAERLRGVAVVAGGASGRPDCTGPVAAMIIHNPEDRLVSFDQGVRIRDVTLAQNRLRIADAAPTEPAALNCEVVAPTSANPVIWCPHLKSHSGNGRYYPHRWPDEAGSAIMRFFDGLR